ncbi:hypothetical protein DF947_18470 [Pedobacter paludis]|uniref:Uncharacterized protein n=1 Tax=Pedobacter paludis TaxID=2203212 RepID=A0A317EXE7_9SPHI|nr:hypothetical protein DF947_18470 [Pedobacter paludis]
MGNIRFLVFLGICKRYFQNEFFYPNPFSILLQSQLMMICLIRAWPTAVLISPSRIKILQIIRKQQPNALGKFIQLDVAELVIDFSTITFFYPIGRFNQ